MPNGGSDCCGTCWFNAVHANQAEQARCLIRNFEVPNPFYTYCVNHQRHNPTKVRTPLGPVFTADGYPYTRRTWLPAPDSEQVREQLLLLLDGIKIADEEVYPSALDIE
jgi:hypothetical protein